MSQHPVRFPVAPQVLWNRVELLVVIVSSRLEDIRYTGDPDGRDLDLELVVE